MSAAANTMFDAAWLDNHREDILEPDLPIIDPHHHVWYRPDARYLLEELLADFDTGHAIRASVFVECQTMYRSYGPGGLRPVGETEFANGVAAMSASGVFGSTRACAGIVGHADLRLGAAVSEVLEAHLRVAGDRFRGIRQVAAFDPLGAVRSHAVPPAGLLTDAGFLEGYGQLAPLGLSFDAWVYHHQLPDVVALAERFPDTVLIVNHTGGPLGIGAYAERQEEVWQSWRRGIRALARHENVYMKIGGLGMRIAARRFYEEPTPPSSADLASTWKPHVEEAINAFGSGRCMFESNFPVDKRSCRYDVLWNGFKRLAAGCSNAEKAALFFGTAQTAYRLDGILPQGEIAHSD